LRKGLLLALLTAVLAGVVAWQAGWQAGPPAPVPTRPRPSPPPAFQSEWATEQDWIVDTISRDVREMAAFAAGLPLPDRDAPAIHADLLTLEPHIFAPAVYAPLAAEVLATTALSSPRPSSGAEDARLLKALLDLRAEVAVRESARVSGRLETEPSDPDAHERAALLLGAFALRDSAGYYSDDRPALCRLTAHLSLARALRGGAPPGLAGRFAGVLLDSLVGRERDALQGLDTLAGGTRVERAWVRALRLRNTGDWRIARETRGLTLLEKLQEFSALAGNLDDLTALDWLEEQGTPEPVPDWGLMALNGGGSVETYNRFAPGAAMSVIAEAAAVWDGLDRPPFDDLEGFLEALNARPGRLLVRDDTGGARPAVLGWGLWADRAQRHLVYALVLESVRLGGMLGRRGADEAFAEEARSFSRLELFPLLLANLETDLEHYRPAMAACRELALRAPERLTPGAWSMLRRERSYADFPRDFPDPATWFRPPLLPGTIMAFHYRVELPELSGQGLARLQELHDLAPYNLAVALATVERLPLKGRTVADLVPLYGALAQYSVYVMGELTDAAWYDPPEFKRRQGALCELLAEKCFHLGYRLAELGFPEEAAAAYQSGFDRARDRVMAANQAEWLVRHYLETGQSAQAESVGRRAAATHSAQGLLTMAMVMEETGKIDEAEGLCRQVFETYDEPLPMAGFYYRQARVGGNETYEPRLREALALALPDKRLEPLDRAALVSPPADGVVFKGANDNTERYGVKWGHVIVGLDGFRVRDVETYQVVRALSYSPQMKLVVWRGASYDDIEVELWDRRFRVPIDDLAPKKESRD
jgi:tetratricopeptide (TPR) repeat protein